jgi:hypothetical protein
VSGYAMHAVRIVPRAVICEPGHRRSKTRDVIFLISADSLERRVGPGAIGPAHDETRLRTSTDLQPVVNLMKSVGGSHKSGISDSLCILTGEIRVLR